MKVDEKLEQHDDAPPVSEVKDDQIVEMINKNGDMEKFKKVSFELLDIGLYYGQQGVEKVKSYPIYQQLDNYVKFDDQFDLVKRHGEQLYTYLNQKLAPIATEVFFLYDKYTNKITSFIKVLSTRQVEITTYVTKTYTHFSVTANENWLRLDFNHDGSVSVDDLKQSMVSLYEFLRNFDYVETSTQIKSKLYTDAIAYMQQELEENAKNKAIEDGK